MTAFIAPAIITGVPVVLVVLAVLGLLITLTGLTGMLIRRPTSTTAEPTPPRVLV